MAEEAIRKAAASYLSEELAKRNVELLLPPTVWHGKGSLSSNLARNVDINPIDRWDPEFEQDLEYMDIEPDLVAVCGIGNHALTFLGECKAKGNIAIRDLAQVLLYSTVSKAIVSAMFFTGSPSQPVRKLLDDEVLRYHGYDRNRELKEKLIGFYQHGGTRTFQRLWPTYDVLNL